MSDRFFADDDFRAPVVDLTGPEAHHLTHVLRKRTGDEVRLFNGRGFEAVGVIDEAGRKRTTVRITAVHELPDDEGRDVRLAVAVPKGERFRWLVEKAAELGVRRLIPLQTERSVVTPSDGKLNKARQAVIEAAKQSGAARLMQIDDVCDWDMLLATTENDDTATFIAHPGGIPVAEALAAVPEDRPVQFAIGPEGGFTDAEVTAADAAGIVAVDLGPQILRIETSAIALAALARLAPRSQQ